MRSHSTDMKRFLLLSFLHISLAACQRDIGLVRSCDCELNFLILADVDESGENETDAPEWEIGAEKGKDSGVEGDVRSKKQSESTRWKKKYSLPFSQEEQGRLTLIAIEYKKKCLNLCSDQNLSEQEFRARMGELDDTTMQKAWESLGDTKRTQESLSAPLPRIEKHTVSCLSEEDVKWHGGVLTFRHECLQAGQSFRLVATAVLANGTKETNPHFLKGKLNARTSTVQFDLSKLNWKYLSSQEIPGLRLIEARISIPVEGGEEKAVVTVFFDLD